MDRATQLGKWIYSGLLGIALTIAGLHAHVQAPWKAPQEVVAQVAKKSGEKTSPPQAAPRISDLRFSPLAVAQTELGQALTWNELRSFPSSAYKDFVAQLAQEEFDNGQPFRLAEQRSLWLKALGEGLKDYSRKIYRSPHFQGGSGYDLVAYELLHENGRKAHLLAYREKVDGLKLTIGGEDLRPTRLDLYTQNDQGIWLRETFEVSGERLQQLELTENEVLASRDAIVNLSVPLLTAGR